MTNTVEDENMETFDERLNRLDDGLFSSVPTQSSPDDRKAWLAVQRAMRRGGYTYLEIGSYLGGSIQQHVLDPLCRHIVSIDKRPDFQPDERGDHINYEGGSTARMMEYLNKVDASASSKVATFEADAKDVDTRLIPEPPAFCFIDGEHTHAAVVSDFEFCLRVARKDAAICFHDARLIHSALSAIMASLSKRGIIFTARGLTRVTVRGFTGDTFGIFLGDCPAASDPYIAETSAAGKPFIAEMRIRKAVNSALPDWSHRLIRTLIPAP